MHPRRQLPERKVQEQTKKKKEKVSAVNTARPKNGKQEAGIHPDAGNEKYATENKEPDKPGGKDGIHHNLLIRHLPKDKRAGSAAEEECLPDQTRKTYSKAIFRSGPA